MTLQTAYNETMPVAVPGMVANTEAWNTITRIADNAIAFGMPARRTGDNTCALPGAPTLTAAATITGADSITASPTVGLGAMVGTYNGVCISSGATGKWAINAPTDSSSGAGGSMPSILGVATTGTPFTGGGLTFTITDAGGHAAVGDTLSIVVSATTDAGEILGIVEKDVVLEHSTSPDSYAQYDSVAIRTMGVIWVTAGATVSAGDPLFWDSATTKYTNDRNKIRVPGFRFETAASDGNLVKVARR